MRYTLARKSGRYQAVIGVRFCCALRGIMNIIRPRPNPVVRAARKH